MGVDLERVGGPVAARVEHPPPQHHVPEAPHHPALAAELALDRGRHLLLGDRLGLVNGAPAPLGELEGEADVLAATRVELDVRLAAHRIDRSVPGGDPRQPRLPGAHGHLVAPVEALLVAPLSALEAHLPTRVADPPVGEAADEAAQRIRAPVAVGVREGQDRARRARCTAWLRAATLPPRGSSRTRSAPAARASSAVRSLEPSDATTISRQLCRVVERPRIGDLALDHLLLVVGGDDQASRGEARPRRRPHRSRPCPRSHRPRRRSRPAPRAGADSPGGRRRSGRRRPRRRSRAPSAGDYRTVITCARGARGREPSSARPIRSHE